MTASIVHHVNVSLALEGTGPQPAGFGKAMFVAAHALETPRQAGPFTALSDLTDAGHLTTSDVYLWATAFLAQTPRATTFYIGRIDSGDASLTASLNAINDEDPTSAYGWEIASRVDQDILDFDTWLSTQAKIGVAQTSAASILAGTGAEWTDTIGGTTTDGDYDQIFTGFGLAGSPVTVTSTRSTTPTDNDAMAAAIVAELITQNSGGGDIEGVLEVGSISATDNVVTFKITDGLVGVVTEASPSPGTQTLALVDADIGTVLFVRQNLRMALLYYQTDTVDAAGAWLSRCLSFDLDSKKGSWSYKKLNGIPTTALSNAETAAVRAINCNYYAQVAATSGVVSESFTFPGVMASGAAGAGQRIDITTSLDWMQARFEEALFGVFTRETHMIGYDDAGINRFGAAATSVFGTGVNAGHLVPFVGPEGEDYAGELTPLVDLPLASSLTAAVRTSGLLTFSGIAYLRESIERVTFSVELRR